MPYYKILIFTITLLLGKHSAGFAQEIDPIEADRPDQTESPSTVPINHFQMETGFLFEQTDKQTKNYSAPTMLLKYGLGKNFELGVIPEFAVVKTKDVSVSGFNPLSVRFKEKITEEKRLKPAITFIGYLSLPNVASNVFKATYLAPAFKFAFQNTISKKISLGYNIGANWDGETAQPEYIYSLSAGFSLSSKIGSFAEVYGFLSEKSAPDHRVDMGFNYLLKNNIMIDISGGEGLNAVSPNYFLSAGFSFRLKN